MTPNKKPLISLENLKKDLPSSIVVYLVAIPLCLGIALASTDVPEAGVTPNLFAGIISGIIGGLVVGSLSGSRIGVSGPAAGLITIVSAAIVTLGSFQAFLLAIVLAGILQLVAGVLKAGIIGHYFPSSVIKGMLAGIGIILILKEIPHAMGYDKDFFGDLNFFQSDGHNTISELYYAIIGVSPGAVIISVISLALLILFERPFMKKIGLFKFLPGALFVVLLGIGINFLYTLVAPEWVMKDEHLVKLPVATSFDSFISFFTTPDFSAITNPDVYVIAFTIAMVASLETLLSVEATDKLDPHKHITPTNRELMAQGTGNILSGLIGGLPITQVIVRSTANVNSGAASKLSAILHGMILLVSVIIIPKFLNMIPFASLAAILLVIGYKLAKIELFKQMYRIGWDQFIPFVVTIIAILLSDLLTGIAIGMGIAIFFILRKNYQNSYAKKISSNGDKQEIRIELSEEVTFLNKGSILHSLEEVPHGSYVVVDASRSKNIHYDVIEIIKDFKHTAKDKNIRFEIIGIKALEKEATS